MDSSWNPYWDEIGYDKVGIDQLHCRTVVQVPYSESSHRMSCFDYDYIASVEWRRKLVPRYAWTISDPDTVGFVLKHSGALIIDPMAGTGYWARLLTERGRTVRAYDLCGDRPQDNKWHAEMPQWTTVLPGDAPVVTAEAGPEPTLLLSWPPMNEPLGYRTVKAYQGDRIVYMGDGNCDFTGDEQLRKLLENDWDLVAGRTPVQWNSTGDNVYAYQRKA